MSASAILEGNFSGQESIPGTIVDPHGDVLPSPKQGLMGKLDELGQQSVTLTKSTLWIFGTIIAVVPISLAILVYLLSGAMSYQGVVSRVDNAEKRLDKLEALQTEVNNLAQTTSTVSATVNTIKDSQKEMRDDQKDMLKQLNQMSLINVAKQNQ